MKIQKFKTTLHRDLYQDLMSIIRKEERQQELNKLKKLNPVIVGKESGYEWLIFSIVLLATMIAVFLEVR